MIYVLHITYNRQHVEARTSILQREWNKEDRKMKGNLYICNPKYINKNV